MVTRLAAIFKPAGADQLSVPHGWRNALSSGDQPRFSSSTSLRAAFGYNEAAMSVEYYLHGKRPETPKIRPGRGWRYYEDLVATMIAIISDVHGNLPRTEGVLEKIDALGCRPSSRSGTSLVTMPSRANASICCAKGVSSTSSAITIIISSAAARAAPARSWCRILPSISAGIITPDQVAWLAQSRSTITDGSTCFVHGVLAGSGRSVSLCDRRNGYSHRGRNALCRAYACAGSA